MNRIPENSHKKIYHLACELLEIGIREDFTSQEFQASPWFNLKGKHMRAQQIGMMLHELGGLNLMVTIAVFIQRQLDFQRMKSLGACWNGIGKW